MLSEYEWQAVELSLQVSVLAVICSLPFGILMAWLLVRCQFPGKALLEGGYPPAAGFTAGGGARHPASVRGGGHQAGAGGAYAGSHPVAGIFHHHVAAVFAWCDLRRGVGLRPLAG